MFHQRDANVTPIEISRKIEEMRLETEIAAANGGPGAEIGDAVVPLDRSRAPFDADAHGIDAARRAEIVAQAQIGGGKADRTTAPVAGLDASFDFEGMAQQPRRLARFAPGQIPANSRRGEDGAVARRNRLQHAHAEAMVLSLLLQERGVAAALVAEMEVVPDDYVAGAKPLDQEAADEILSTHLRERSIEMQHGQQIDAQGFDAVRLGAERRQPKRWRLGMKILNGMRLEGHERQRCAHATRGLAGEIDDRAMTQVDAVEIADGDHGAAVGCGGLGRMAKNAHERRSEPSAHSRERAAQGNGSLRKLKAMEMRISEPLCGVTMCWM